MQPVAFPPNDIRKPATPSRSGAPEASQEAQAAGALLFATTGWLLRDGTQGFEAVAFARAREVRDDLLDAVFDARFARNGVVMSPTAIDELAPWTGSFLMTTTRLMPSDRQRTATVMPAAPEPMTITSKVSSQCGTPHGAA